MTTETTANAYGIRWMQFNRRDELVARQRFFSTAKAREAFAVALEIKPNFAHVTAWSGPELTGIRCDQPQSFTEQEAK